MKESPARAEPRYFLAREAVTTLRETLETLQSPDPVIRRPANRIGRALTWQEATEEIQARRWIARHLLLRVIGAEPWPSDR